MGRIIHRVFGIIEGVNVEIDFDPIFVLTRAHARFMNFNHGSVDFMLATATCKPLLYAGKFRGSRTKLGWWNGRHVRLRGVCRKACGFKSRPEHFFIAKVHRLLVRRWQANRRRREQSSEKRREDAHALPKLRETESTRP